MHSNLINLDLSNSNYWEQEIFEIRQRPQGESGVGLPISDFDLPLFERSRVMACRCYNPIARPWWKLGCYLKQVVPAPGGNFSDGNLEVASWRVPLYHRDSTRQQRIFFPDPAPLTWQLKVSVPEWHFQIELTIWRFTGEISPSLADQISQIDAKLNRLLSP